MIFLLLFFALKNSLVLLAKFNSGELHCPATALIFTWSGIRVYKQWVPSGCNSSYSFTPKWRCACRLGIILWSFFLTFSALWTYRSLFWGHEMLSKCIDSTEQVPCGCNFSYSFPRLFWNFADVFCMEWKCASGLGLILFYYFFSLFLFCELSLFFFFFWHEMLSKCIDSGCLVGTTPLTVFHILY